MAGARASALHDLEDPATTTKLTKTGRISKALKGRRTHRCETCEKSYTRAEHLRRHQLNHQQKAYRCHFPGCGRDFHRQDLLHKHEVEHPSHFAQPRPPDASNLPFGRLEIQVPSGGPPVEAYHHGTPHSSDGYASHHSQRSADGLSQQRSPDQPDSASRHQAPFLAVKDDAIDPELKGSSVTPQESPSAKKAAAWKDYRPPHEREAADARFKGSADPSPTSQSPSAALSSSLQPARSTDHVNQFIAPYPGHSRQGSRNMPPTYESNSAYTASPQPPGPYPPQQSQRSLLPPQSLPLPPRDYQATATIGPPPTFADHSSPISQKPSPSTNPASFSKPRPDDVSLFHRFIETLRRQPCQSRRSDGHLKCLRPGCGGAFEDKTSWLWHVEQMVPRRLSKCPACPEIFQRQEGLANHMRKHHPSNEQQMIIYEVPFHARCGFCNFESTSWHEFFAGHVHDHFVGKLPTRRGADWNATYPPPLVPVPV